ncbi:MAG: hypothetical protein US74_C0031G0004 [Parcubacteria group bacterium GW2011_GWA2_38_13]|nr:MAG: hypothetical protein US74_C0031G0004 [Parcubacteria group bacterium GW2011_GWA2_38_13]
MNKYKKNLFYLMPSICLLLVFFLSISLSISPVFAWTFNPNNIISDNELKDSSALSVTAIQKFLERENSVLATYSAPVNNQMKSASEIIWEIGKNNNISQKFLLTTLEKEKGLIQKTTASQKDFDWATGYSCFNGKCNDKYKGFFDQVESTAITQNIYFDKAQQFTFQKSVLSKTTDGYMILPKNQATANLYVYTPYIGYAPDYGYTNIESGAGRFGANYLFWQIWTRYFSDKKIPNDFLIKNNTDYWRIENGEKRKFAAREIYLKDYKDEDAIFVTVKILDAYDNGPIIYFSNNSLVRSGSSNQAFLLMGNVKRPLVDSSALAALSDLKMAISTIDDVPLVENEKLESYILGNPITAQTTYPHGKLFRDETGNMYLVQDTMKYPVSPIIAQINFPAKEIQLLSITELEKYITGSAVPIKDGAIIKNSKGELYVISDKEKIKIKDTSVFIKIFGEPKYASAITVPDEIINVHESGLNIAYIDDSLQDSNTSPGTIRPTYLASLEGVSPESLVLFYGASTNVTITIRNNGSALWKSSDIWLETQNDPARHTFIESQVASGEIATFTLPIQSPQTAGLTPIGFSLYRNNSGSAENILSFGRFVIVQYADSAKIISHNIPVAVRNIWKPISVIVKIKNNSTSTPWLSRKTALELYDGSGKASPFYDPNDWVRKEVVSVPLNKTTIKPGETAEFKFTLNAKGLKPGVYTLKFKLNLLDKNKEVVLDNSKEWTRTIRVDK